ncbi:MAG: catalase [Candidatus Dormibacteraeota bacterium]|nr:catalase [Candidatus Dormibacteraeota bacterium]
MADGKDADQAEEDAKQAQLKGDRRAPGGHLTTDQGVRVDDTDNSLQVGERGPTLLEDFHAREKITHFDHERIPERVVHARGAGAYGYFELEHSLAEWTAADFLQRPGERTPVFVRFSTVAGSRGSADTVRDVRGFATKFYTRQGNYDLVGNNFPVFFIQDGIKFPDFVHAVKPEPDCEMPQAASAHDTFWDFVTLQPEATHMVLWLMSDRAIPRSYRMMEGFGVHTFRFVNREGRGTFVKFHWLPRLGTHSLVWEEAQGIAGKDPDFNRRDLWESIEAGAFPEWELGVQLVPEEEEHRFDFDLLDPTKIVPEEEVPIRPVGRLVLNRNPDNFFAETEQVAFHTANVVPGIDFTNDPLLQARNFSYLDTQLIRLGGPNFSQLPVNRPVAEVANDHRDGYAQTSVHGGRAAYQPASVGPHPDVDAGAEGVFSHYQERIDGTAIRRRSSSFQDHYSQATLFWNSMSGWERDHIVAAYCFELGKVTVPEVQQRALERLRNVDLELARRVAGGLGLQPPGSALTENHGRRSPALSLLHRPGETVPTRKVAVMIADGVRGTDVEACRTHLGSKGVVVETIAPHGGRIPASDGATVTVDRALPTVGSVLYDAVLVLSAPEGPAAPAMRDFVIEAFRHGKAVGVLDRGVDLVQGTPVGESDRGVVTSRAGSGPDQGFLEAFEQALAAGRHWDRDLAAVMV